MTPAPTDGVGARTFRTEAAKLCAVPCDAPLVAGEVGAVWARTAPLPRLELAVRVALVAGIAYQVIQRFTYTGYGMSEYGRSLWYVTYQHGFVRRGLAGEVLRTIVGGRPTIATVDLVRAVAARRPAIASPRCRTATRCSSSTPTTHSGSSTTCSSA